MYNIDKFEVDHSVALRRNLQNLLIHMNQVDGSVTSFTYYFDTLRINDNLKIKSPEWVNVLRKLTYDVKCGELFKLS